MEKKKPGTVTVPKENVKELLGKAKDGIVKAMDQNGDGTFDMKDVSVIAGSIGNAAKDTIYAMKESAEERSRIAERKALCPIFADDLDSADFALTKLIRITDIDKKRAESEVCRDSIGYVSAQKDLRIVNIYRKSAEMFGLSFYPDMDREIYYVDPTDRNSYIALEEYFSYLKLVRVGELQKTAQDLGAKYFKVTLKENNMSHSKKETKAKEKAKIVSVKESAEGKMDVTTSEASSLEVAAEMQCVGHPPKAGAELSAERSRHSVADRAANGSGVSASFEIYSEAQQLFRYQRKGRCKDRRSLESIENSRQRVACQ